jgi:hypothetical protein
MGKIYKGQSALRITLNTFCDLEEAVTSVIRYKKPDGSCGEMPAAIADVDKGVIFHEILEEELNCSGWWSFWAFVTFADSRMAAGEAAKVFIWSEGSG